MRSIAAFLFLVFALISCSPKESSQTDSDDFNSVPEWAKEAIWYQIFPERFYNGDVSNDPRPEDIVGSYPGFVPEAWEISPWTMEWHREDHWMKGLDSLKDLSGNYVQSFNQKVQLRRYGGDLAGVLAKLDYLEDLGVNAIYFNPLNDAPSLHKYDARNWRHIDRNFGPDPEGDAEMIAAENPIDPDTWQWTKADQLFLKLVQEIHKRDMKLILDYSWNHTGTQFWAWQDLLKKQSASDFKDWYWTQSLDDPSTDSNEFSYRGWLGVPSLPEIQDTPFVDHSEVVKAFEGQVASQAVKDHIYAISRRWLDPNQDGDPRDGVDGFRLDVAAEMPLGFWREFRQEVRRVNPEAYLVGEVWWQKWPDQLIDPKPFLQGDVFDGVMNYRWFRSVRRFIAAAPDSMTPMQLRDSLESYAQSADLNHQLVWMNMSASHDAPRLSTALFNRNPYKVGTGRDNFEYKIHKPDLATRNRQLLFLHLQFTMPGAPQIYNGDEMGMWGEDDPGNRKPLIWPEFDFEAESSYPFIGDLKNDIPRFDQELFEKYQELIQLRKDEPTLMHGAISFPDLDVSKQLFIYDRIFEGDTLRVVLNNSYQSIPLELEGADLLKGISLDASSLSFFKEEIPPLSFALFRLQ